MREFQDEGGSSWIATVGEEAGTDYKGRYFFVVSSKDDAARSPVSLSDVRWNSQRTAERTLRTMSEVELRRRLRWAVGRGS